MKEKIKSYILLLLIAAIVVEVGILWGYQNHGLPTGFLKAFFPGNQSIPADSKLREEYFVPFRMIASDGNESHWIISRNTSDFSRIWEEARSALSQVLVSKQLPADTSEDWGTLVTKRGFVFEFKSDIRFELLKWFLALPAASQEEPYSLRKVMIVPGLYDAATLYVLDGNPRSGKVLEYSVTVPADEQTGNIYEGILSKLEKDDKNRSLAYSVISELYGKSLPGLSPDILFVTMGSNYKYRQYKSLNYAVPGMVYDLDQAADIIFKGNEKDSYDSYEDQSETKIFMNLDNIYRVYDDGLVEYRYLPGYEGVDRGPLSAAFVIAAKFIGNVRSSLNIGAGIYLSGITEEQGAYRFTFDYMEGDIPVYFNLEPRGESSEPVGSAIVIRGNSRRMLSCRWMLKTMDSAGGAGSYNLNLTELLDASGLKRDSVVIDDMGIAYVINQDMNRKVEPVWAIEMAEGKNHFVRLRRKQEE